VAKWEPELQLAKVVLQRSKLWSSLGTHCSLVRHFHSNLLVVAVIAGINLGQQDSSAQKFTFVEEALYYGSIIISLASLLALCFLVLLVSCLSVAL